MSVANTKWGNGAEVHIPSVMMRAAHLDLEQDVDVREERGSIVLTPVPSPGYDLVSLVDGITDDNLHTEISTGDAVGRELWQAMPAAHLLDAGDIVWLQVDPQARHERAGHLPAFVLSPASYKVTTSLQLLLDAGAEELQAITDVGGGKLIASMKDADGNFIGHLQPA
jgi:antitoxin MazE